jgi:hypothetical protein
MQYYVPRTKHITSARCSPHKVDGSENQVVIQDSLNELLELVPAVPKLHRMNVLLKEHEWDEGHEDDDDESFGAVSTGDRSYTPQWRGLQRLFSKAKRKRFTVEDAQVELQASEQEISQVLKDKHILTIHGEFPLNRFPFSQYPLTSRCVLCSLACHAHKAPRSPRRTSTRSSSSS